MLESILPIVQQFITGIGVTTIVGIALAAITKFVPNNKLQDFGYKLGVSLSAVALLRVGPAWEKIEDFLTQSIGQVLIGFKKGLDSDDPDTSQDAGSQEHQ